MLRQLTSLDAQFLALENAAPDRPRRRPGDPRPVDGARRHARRCADIQRAARRAPAAAAAAALAAGRGAARARLPLLGRRRRLRPRLPRARARAARARHRRRSSPSRSRGSCRGRWTARARCGSSTSSTACESGHVGDAHEDPPRASSTACRARRSWACCSTSTPEGRELPTPTASGDGTAERRARPAARCSPAACSACRATRCARCASLPARDARTSRTRRSATLPGAGHGRPRRRPRAAARRAATARRASGRKLVAPKTSFNGRISAAPPLRLRPARRSTRSRRSRTTTACTVNDVVVSICAGAVRRWLIEHDELPDDAARRADPGVGAHRRAGRAPTATASC